MDVLNTLIQLQATANLIMGIAEIEEESSSYRRWWVHPINQKRKIHGDYYSLIVEMRQHDPEMFFSYTRMSIEQFDWLLNLVGPYLTKFSRREPLPEALRLLVTLR